VHQLSIALKHPDTKFRGPLKLSGNVHLTDLTGLYLSEIFSAKHGHALRELDLSGNIKMESKSAQFIGEALLANPTYPIEELKFKGVNLEETGLYRLIEAVNANKHIHKLHVGIISDYGLRTMSELLKANRSLLKL